MYIIVICLTALLRLITCLNLKDFKGCVDAQILNVVYTLLAHIPSSYYIVYNLVELIGEEYRSGKRIIIEVVVFSTFLFLYAQDVFTNHLYSMLPCVFCVLYHIAIGADVAYSIYTKNGDKTERVTQNVISSMRFLQTICFIIIMMSIYDIFIHSFKYYPCMQALQYSIPAGYLLIDAFIFGQSTSDMNEIEDGSMYDHNYKNKKLSQTS